MESSDSWEEATEDYLEVVPCRRADIRRSADVRAEAIHRILWIFGKILAPVMRPVIEENVDLHVDEKLREYVNSLENIGEAGRAVILFKLLILFGIPSRIYIVLSEGIKCFVESRILGAIREHHGRYNACVVSVDASLRLRDQSYYFSKSTRHLASVQYVVRQFPGPDVCGEASSEEMTRCFDDLDERRMSKIPTSVEKMKRHPKFIVESILRWDQCIYPKRPTFGLFKGEAIYLRENVVRLRTREQLYRMGKVIDSPKPYRIIRRDKEIRLYAPWQTRDLVVEGFCESMYQDYLHPNFIPRDCVYIDNKNARDVARLLGLPHRICFHGFSRGVPVNRGIFLEKKNLYVFSNFLAQYCRYLEMKERSECRSMGLKRWRILIRNASRYLRIRKSLGLK
ncbi:Rad4 beta-hairpin domain-containing protein [Encephalitozoon cuniculi]|nr:Rad4 beta-hairpin domain-containing protein [Encephalitozoon cuniculi]